MKIVKIVAVLGMVVILGCASGCRTVIEGKTTTEYFYPGKHDPAPSRGVNPQTASDIDWNAFYSWGKRN
jgi:hypothetical protein